MKTAAMRKVHADGNPNMPRIKKMSPQEWSHERYQADVKRTLQMQKDLQDREEARRQQAALAGRPVQGQLPLSQQQMAAAAAAATAAAQRRNAMGAAQNMPQQASAPQVNQAARVQNAIQNGVVNGMGMAGLSQVQQLQALQNLQQQAGRMGQNSAEAAQLAALQQRQLQQMGQLPSQTANLVAAHLSPSGGNMQNTHQQQILAAMQRANFANANGLGGMNAMGASPTSAATSLNNTVLSLMHRIQQSNPHLTADQIRRLATEQVRRQMNQNALAAASGASSVAGLAGLPSQQAALAQQHLGLHGQTNPQMLAAYAAHAAQQQAAQQQAQNAGLGPMVSPAQGLAAAVMAQGQQMSSNAAAALTNSPTQMYGRPMSAQAHVAAAHHQRLPSGSPGLVPARPDSRGGPGGTPGLANGMVRSMSGTASQSPILGGAGGVAR
jgi:chromatin modification-related protein VID21